jgi:exopolysaccharide biosynthesis protein
MNLPAVYSANTGLFLSAWGESAGGTTGIVGHNVKKLVESGKVTDTFCFGPPSLINGRLQGSNGGARAQRTMMGTNGNAGDIWIVVSDGRKNDGESAGLTFYEGAQYLKDKGCTFGIHLDGGGSSTMYFRGKVLNAVAGNERAVVDFVYFK